MVKHSFLVILFAGTAISVCAAQGQNSDKENLLGRWAAECSLPPSAANPYVEFSAHDGQIVRTAFTDHEKSVYLVRTVSFENGAIRLVFGPTDTDVISVYAEYSPGVSMRTIESFIDQPGHSRQFGIRNGQQLINHHQATLVLKCLGSIS